MINVIHFTTGNTGCYGSGELRNAIKVRDVPVIGAFAPSVSIHDPVSRALDRSCERAPSGEEIQQPSAGGVVTCVARCTHKFRCPRSATYSPAHSRPRRSSVALTWRGARGRAVLSVAE